MNEELSKLKIRAYDLTRQGEMIRQALMQMHQKIAQLEQDEAEQKKGSKKKDK